MIVSGFISPSASARLIFINKLQSPFCLHHEQFWKINSKYFASTSSAPTFNKIPFWYVIVIVVSHHCVIISMTDAPSCTHGFPSPLNQFSLIKHFSENLGGFHFTGMVFSLQSVWLLPASSLCTFRSVLSFRSYQSCQVSGECHYLSMSKCRLRVKLVTGHTGGVWVTEELKCSVLRFYFPELDSTLAF